MFDAISKWFKNSETILWARLQILIGAVWAVLSVADLSPILSGKYLAYWTIFSGVVTELARRRATYTDNQGYLQNANPPKVGG